MRVRFALALFCWYSHGVCRFSVVFAFGKAYLVFMGFPFSLSSIELVIDAKTKFIGTLYYILARSRTLYLTLVHYSKCDQNGCYELLIPASA